MGGVGREAIAGRPTWGLIVVDGRGTESTDRGDEARMASRTDDCASVYLGRQWFWHADFCRIPDS